MCSRYFLHSERQRDRDRRRERDTEGERERNSMRKREIHRKTKKEESEQESEIWKVQRLFEGGRGQRERERGMMMKAFIITLGEIMQ